MERVFVYGILMRNGGEPAFVEDHKLRFYGFASCEDSPGDRCYGMLLTVSEKTLVESFDNIEGYRPSAPLEGLYRRERVTVTSLDDGQQHEACVYKMNHGRYGYEGPSEPSEHMIKRMRCTYEVKGMPTKLLDDAVSETVDPFTMALAGKEG